MQPSRQIEWKTLFCLCLPLVVFVVTPMLWQKLNARRVIGKELPPGTTERGAIVSLSKLIHFYPAAKQHYVTWDNGFRHKAYLSYKLKENQLVFLSGCDGTCPISPTFLLPVATSVLRRAGEKNWTLGQLEAATQK